MTRKEITPDTFKKDFLDIAVPFLEFGGLTKEDINSLSIVRKAYNVYLDTMFLGHNITLAEIAEIAILHFEEFHRLWCFCEEKRLLEERYAATGECIRDALAIARKAVKSRQGSKYGLS